MQIAAADTTAILERADQTLQLATRMHDTATIKSLITDDFTLITNSAKVYDAQEFLADVGDRDIAWQTNDPESVSVRVYNDDCGVVTAILHQKFTYHSKDYDYRVRFTDTWVKRDGQWRYAAGHASLMKQ